MTDCRRRLTRMPWWPDGLYQDARGYYRHIGPELDLDTFEGCSVAVGRNNAPAPARVPGAVASAWSAAEYPERAGETALRIDLFAVAGYTDDGQPADRPSEPVRVFRGCTSDLIYNQNDEYYAEPRFGMSWTTDVEIARRFASGGIRGRASGHVYVATVQPEHLLAYLGAEHGGESEFVVHPYGLSNDNVEHHESLVM